MEYEVRMRVTISYKKMVEADSEEAAKEIAWNSGDFGEACDIDGEIMSCELMCEPRKADSIPRRRVVYAHL